MTTIDWAGAVVFTVACLMGAAGLFVVMHPRYKPVRDSTATMCLKDSRLSQSSPGNQS
jgi:hypothetical protein